MLTGTPVPMAPAFSARPLSVHRVDRLPSPATILTARIVVLAQPMR
jgi:hypothetical protein